MQYHHQGKQSLYFHYQGWMLFLSHCRKIPLLPKLIRSIMNACNPISNWDHLTNLIHWKNHENLVIWYPNRVVSSAFLVILKLTSLLVQRSNITSKTLSPVVNVYSWPLCSLASLWLPPLLHFSSLLLYFPTKDVFSWSSLSWPWRSWILHWWTWW